MAQAPPELTRPSFAEDVWTRSPVPRPRVTAQLLKNFRARVCLIAARAGFGKTIALDEALDTLDRPVARFDLGPHHATFERFVRGLVEALASTAPQAQRSFAGAHDRALQTSNPEHALAIWLSEHLKVPALTIAIDELHYAHSERERIADFLTELVEHTPTVNWVFVTRDPDFGFPLPRWLAEGIMEIPIDAYDLVFNEEDAALAQSAGDGRPADELERIVRECDGWPMGVMFALGADHGSRAVYSYGELAQRIFAKRKPREREFLLSTALLPYIDDALCEAAGWHDAAQLLRGLDNDAAFIFRVADKLQYHDGFSRYLLQVLRERGSAAFGAVLRIAASALEACDKPAEALMLYKQFSVPDEIVRLLNAHGLHLLEHGSSDIVAQALAQLDFKLQEESGVILAIKAIFESRAGRFDTFMAWFQLAIERIDEPNLRAEIAYLYGSELLRGRHTECIGIFEQYANEPALPPRLRALLRSALAEGYMLVGDSGHANSEMQRALVLGTELDDMGVLARLSARAAYIALYSGNPALAREHAKKAVLLSEDSAEFSTAAGANSVLYVLAFEVDDEPEECLRYLERVGECGLKCGNPQFELYALINSYELQVERGDEEAYMTLGRALESFDVHYGAHESLEALLPSQALLAAWSGNFAHAYSLLCASADEQSTDDRRALRWSEVTLYAAAAQLVPEARTAAAATHAALQATARTIRSFRAQLWLALAMRLLGEQAQSDELLENLSGEAPSLRSHVLLLALREVCRNIDGAPNDERLVRAIAQLVHHDAAGLGKMLLAIPTTRKVADTGALRKHHGGHLIAALDADREEVVSHLLDATASEHRIGTDVAATQLVDHLVRTLGSSGSTQAWIDEFLSGFEQLEVVRDLAAELPRVIKKYTAERALPHENLTTLAATIAEQIEQSAAVLQRARSISARPALDEVDAALNALIVKLDREDPLTAEHSRAVGSWCTRLARKLGLSAQDILLASRSGLIHDIGKIKTPRDILNAPRRLSDEEMDVMRLHAAAGAEVLREDPILTHLVPAVQSHHERLDGRGYPDGLRGEAIPFIARLVALADSFNAMIGRRPYRRPMAPSHALAELERHRGTQFDPDLVTAMIEIVTGSSPLGLH